MFSRGMSSLAFYIPGPSKSFPFKSVRRFHHPSSINIISRNDALSFSNLAFSITTRAILTQQWHNKNCHSVIRPSRENWANRTVSFLFHPFNFYRTCYMLIAHLVIKHKTNDKKWQTYRSKSDKEKLVHTEIQAR